ncbi:MAG: Gfo/Idh/MocA family oxidoreductase [Pirellulaceae bacterium]|nr:Gfo/Idh/MocA family oxidoreductase [Pirellulaceae bacterium]
MAEFCSGKSSGLDRRWFMRLATAGTATTWVGGELLPAAQPRVETFSVGVIGAGNRGLALLRMLAEVDGCRVTHVCDIDAPRRERALAEARKQNPDAQAVDDPRKLLEDRQVDAVVLALPTHWQAVAGIWAMRAGKDIYLETPIALVPDEVEQLRRAARESNRVAHVGAQLRSIPELEGIRAPARGGAWGRLTHVRVRGLRNRRPVIPGGRREAPAGVDFNLWLGPAPSTFFDPRRFHFAWRWFWEYGTGDQGLDALLWLDLALDLTGMETRLTSVTSRGDFFWREQEWDAPDVQSTAFTLAGRDGPLNVVCESYSWSRSPEPSGVTLFFQGAIVDLDILRVVIMSPDGKVIDQRDWTEQSGRATREHLAAFARSVRSRERTSADVGSHEATSLIHFANASYRLRQESLDVAWEEKRLVNAADANSFLAREYRREFAPDAFGRGR